MKRKCTGWLSLIASACVLLGAPAGVSAAIVSMDLTVSIGILDSAGNPFLADGSTVMIIASTDNVIDPMQTYGGTNFIANSTTGDDVILAVTTIGTGVNPNTGQFFITLLFDNSLYSNVYIRFFEAPPNALTGMIWWGNSTMILAGGVTLGVATVDFNPDGDLQPTNRNNFVIIPEPSTAHLFVVVAGMMWAMRSHRRRKTRAADLADPA